MKSALIFGACGFVGDYLVRELKSNGYTVIGSDVVRNSTADVCDGFFGCDLMSFDAVSELIMNTKPTHIVNLAAISSVGLSWKIPQKTMEVNVSGGLNILEAARLHVPGARLLFIGSSEEYVITDKPIDESIPLNANNPYGISKMALEQFADIYRTRYQMKIYYVRAFNHTGIGQKDTFVIPGWCKQAASISLSQKTGTLKVGNTSVFRDLSHVEDIVRAYRMVIESDDCSVIYNIGSGKAVQLQEIANFLGSLSAVPITIEQDPSLVRPADNPRICCDHSLITERLGWKPQKDIFDTVKEMFDYYCRVL